MKPKTMTQLNEHVIFLIHTIAWSIHSFELDHEKIHLDVLKVARRQLHETYQQMYKLLCKSVA